MTDAKPYTKEELYALKCDLLPPADNLAASRARRLVATLAAAEAERDEAKRLVEGLRPALDERAGFLRRAFKAEAEAAALRQVAREAEKWLKRYDAAPNLRLRIRTTLSGGEGKGESDGR